MKIAGRRNDGAWYRTNQAIRKFNSDQQAKLSTVIQGITGFTDFYSAIKDLGTMSNAPANTVPSTAAALATIYATTGIPRQVWYGVWSFDTYFSKVDGSKTTYSKSHAKTAYAFAVNLRAAMKSFLFGTRQVIDLVNSMTRAQGNPGGIANAHKGD